MCYYELVCGLKLGFKTDEQRKLFEVRLPNFEKYISMIFSDVFGKAYKDLSIAADLPALILYKRTYGDKGIITDDYGKVNIIFDFGVLA